MCYRGPRLEGGGYDCVIGDQDQREVCEQEVCVIGDQEGGG